MGARADRYPLTTAATWNSSRAGGQKTTGPPENPGLLCPSRRYGLPNSVETVTRLTNGTGCPVSFRNLSPIPYGKPKKNASCPYTRPSELAGRGRGRVGVRRSEGASTEMSTSPEAWPTVVTCNGVQPPSFNASIWHRPCSECAIWRAVTRYSLPPSSIVNAVPVSRPTFRRKTL